MPRLQAPNIIFPILTLMRKQILKTVPTTYLYLFMFSVSSIDELCTVLPKANSSTCTLNSISSCLLRDASRSIVPTLSIINYSVSYRTFPVAYKHAIISFIWHVNPHTQNASPLGIHFSTVFYSKELCVLIVSSFSTPILS